MRINTVAPTWTKTTFWKNMPKEEVENIERHFSNIIPLKRTAKVEEVASAYIFLMKNSFITGQTIRVDGGVELV